MSDPTTNGANGRDSRGRFGAGNAGGPGNPFAKKVAALRSALLAAVTEEDIDAVARALVTQAKTGDVAAVRELLDRVLGKASEGADLSDRIDTLEQLLAQVVERKPTRW